MEPEGELMPDHASVAELMPEAAPGVVRCERGQRRVGLQMPANQRQRQSLVEPDENS